MKETARKGKRKCGSARSAARLAAVQALYQIEQTPDADPRAVVAEFRAFRLGRELEGAVYAAADGELFEDLVLGTVARQEEIDAHLADALVEGWPLGRLSSVLRAILRAGTYELVARPDIPTAVVIDEYVDVAHAFYEGAEPGFANGVLDRLAKTLRA